MNDVTYGGLKYCSNTTYIPRNNSVMRKYLPALSNALSFCSSHLSFRGNLKPEGGGPAGVAGRREDVEKAAEKVAQSWYGLDMAQIGPETACAQGRERTTAMRDLVDAMAGVAGMWRYGAIDGDVVE